MRAIRFDQRLIVPYLESFADAKGETISEFVFHLGIHRNSFRNYNFLVCLRQTPLAQFNRKLR